MNGSSDDGAMHPHVRGLVRNLSSLQTELDVKSLAAAYERGDLVPLDAHLRAGDPQNEYLLAAALSTRMADRAADLRTVVTAYAQNLAVVRPALGELAAWQRVTPAALRRRYNKAHVLALQELMSEEPLIDTVLFPFVAVSEHELAGISPALDSQIAQRGVMRQAIEKEWQRVFGDRLPHAMAKMSPNPANARATRLIVDFGQFMVDALERFEPSLLGTFNGWRQRFEAVEPALQKAMDTGLVSRAKKHSDPQRAAERTQ